VSAVDRRVTFLFAAAGLLCAAAIGVRAIPPPRALDPRDVVEEGPRIQEPMQLLGPGAAARAPELDPWVAEARRKRFAELRQVLFRLASCPDAVEWLDSAQGQRLERLLGELRAGTREEALAALALLMRLARATDWEPGLLESAAEADAERIAALYADWLRVWGEPGARDPLLAEPVRAAVLVYALLVETARESPVIGTNAASGERGVALIESLARFDSLSRTALGEALQANHPAAVRRFVDSGERLAGFAAEARTLYPDLKGDCGR
jgi:hypothetical protein